MSECQAAKCCSRFLRTYFFLEILTLKVAGGKAENEFHVELLKGHLARILHLGNPQSQQQHVQHVSARIKRIGAYSFPSSQTHGPQNIAVPWAHGPQITRPFELQLSPAQMSWLWWMWIQRRMVGQSICCLELFFPNPSATKVQVQAPAAQIYGIQIESIHVFFFGGVVCTSFVWNPCCNLQRMCRKRLHEHISFINVIARGQKGNAARGRPSRYVAYCSFRDHFTKGSSCHSSATSDSMRIHVLPTRKKHILSEARADSF